MVQVVFAPVLSVSQLWPSGPEPELNWVQAYTPSTAATGRIRRFLEKNTDCSGDCGRIVRRHLRLLCPHHAVRTSIVLRHAKVLPRVIRTAS